MTRVKRSVGSNKRRKNVLKHTKGFKWGRKSKYKAAKEALMHAWSYAYRDRKVKKREFRKQWQVSINAFSRKLGLPYNKLIHGLKERKIEIDRKILSQLVKEQPEIFTKIVEDIKNK